MTNLLARICRHSIAHDHRDGDDRPALKWTAVAFEEEILATLVDVPRPGEQLAFAFQRKERRLGELFAQLDVSDSRELHRRLTLAADGDAIAASFSRLVADRRARLLAFLSDARRREALRAVRAHGVSRGY
jgi:hypothetical protein